MPTFRSLAVAAALLSAVAAVAQGDGSSPRRSEDPRLLLKYATFDPLVARPEVPAVLRAGADVRLWIVQFAGAPTDADRAPMLAAGARVHGYLPHDSHIVRMDATTSASVATMPGVRWVGAYEPAYRLEAELLAEIAAGRTPPTRAYNMVMADKRNDKEALAARIQALGGKVVDRHVGGLLFTAELTGEQLIAAARLDEVVWIDRWTPPGEDMDNARIVQGSNAVEAAAGYTGAGVRGHVYEGVEATHPDFTTPMTNVRSDGAAQSHGHCTAGCIFGNGASAPQARGHAPAAVGFYTNYATVTAGFSRNAVINEVVNTHQCMFTTASWGSAQTTQYTADSADADDIVFDHRIPWTNSMSNLGNQSVRPQAWAKNVISVGGLSHGNNANPADDVWTTASVGPAADGRIKPDLSNFYDNVWTSDLSGTAGYATGNSYTGFNGTSSATPITAGLNALAIQMYTDHVLNNAPRVPGGTRFQNRPYAQTLKALQIACASQYPVAQASRQQAGWGYANVNTIHTRRNKLTIVPEDAPLAQGATRAHSVQVAPGETSLRVCMTYLEPAAVPAAAQTRINDLTLRVVSPAGVVYFGNNGLASGDVSTPGGAANTIDTVECVVLNNPAAGVWTIEVSAPTVVQDAHLATPATDATYALVVNGGAPAAPASCARYVPDSNPVGGVGNYWPFTSQSHLDLPTIYATDNQGSIGGAMYFNIVVGPWFAPTANPTYLLGMSLNTSSAAGSKLQVDVYRTAVGGTHVGNEANPAAWLPMSAGAGVSAGLNAPSRIDFAEPAYLTPGQYGIAVVARNFEHRYTNGTATNTYYGSTLMEVFAGTASNTPFTAPTFGPRVPNMTMHFVTDGMDGVNMRYQTIIRQAELGGPNTIRSLSFAGGNASWHWNRQLQIRLSHVPAGHVLQSTFANNMPSPQTVLDASNYSFQVAANQWFDIGLQTPFAYNGASDLVVEYIGRGNVQSTPGAFQTFARERVFQQQWLSAGLPPTSGILLGSDAVRMRVGFHCATTNEHGASCGRLRADHVGDGARGTTFDFRVNDAIPSSVAFVSLGLSNTAPWPLNLTSIGGWTNCIGWNDSVTLATVATDAAGVGVYPLAVPNNPALDGFKVFGQWLQLDATEPGSLTFSGQTRLMVGVAF